MTAINRLNIRSIRNIGDTSLEPHVGLNLLSGENGSGKTSVLESFHALATGRSFRSSKLDLLVQHGADSALVFAELVSGHKVGFTKALRSNPILNLNEQKERNWESVSLLLPTLVLDSNTFLLVDGGPKERRSFLDWGVFHVEPDFLVSWRAVKKCIANRNHLLKNSQSDYSHLAAWDEELSLSSDKVDHYRENYIARFNPVFAEVYARLSGERLNEVTIQYLRGWEASKPLQQVLRESAETDRRYGSTQFGPHRAELTIRTGKHKAIDVLSRGQLKLLVMSLRIAQAQLMTSLSSNHYCTFLVDDLAAELDVQNRSAVLTYLAQSSSQVFITAVNESDIANCLESNASLGTFHVERGTIRA